MTTTSIEPTHLTRAERQRVMTRMPNDRIHFLMQLARTAISNDKKRMRFHESIVKNAQKELARRRRGDA